MPDIQSKTLKRKLTSKLSSRKRAKLLSTGDLQTVALEKLPWSTVARPKESGFEFDDGITLLEEVEGVDVVYEETPNGKVVVFNVSHFLQPWMILMLIPFRYPKPL